MRQSNLYIILFAGALTLVSAGLLSLASEGLKERQQANIALEQKKNILSTVVELKDSDNIEEIYAKRVKAFVVDAEGNIKEGVELKKINLAAEYKKPVEQRLLPVYEFTSETEPGKIESVVLPVYGFGLWNDIWGFVALESDFNTIRGVKFDHKGETPGLGARIQSDDEVQKRYKGKSIYDNDKLVSVTMMKGEGNDYASDAHKVDGMSGATLTAKGVNNMLVDYFNSYDKYIKKNSK
ncbi:MAG: NADH:ubiquinone reductase (Na(+)-transporting) subunit C [Cyclobacteriaceae bacterium]|nr:NADH:ubiquinone reductase (Na(+)-transporting) subunit C [Cyclobacteriaceae bacterium]